MKKFMSVTLSICLIFLLSACGNEDDLSKQLELLKEENIQLKEEIDTLNKTYVDLPDTYLHGYFNAVIVDFIKYSMDSEKNDAAVIRLFQSESFIVYVGEEFAEKLKVGERYKFEIEPEYIDRKEFPNPEVLKIPEIAEPALHLSFKNISQPASAGNPCNFLDLTNTPPTAS